jgi:c-di-AMP phosphodiesterase-like protein
MKKTFYTIASLLFFLLGTIIVYAQLGEIPVLLILIFATAYVFFTISRKTYLDDRIDELKKEVLELKINILKSNSGKNN